METEGEQVQEKSIGFGLFSADTEMEAGAGVNLTSGKVWKG